MIRIRFSYRNSLFLPRIFFDLIGIVFFGGGERGGFGSDVILIILMEHKVIRVSHAAFYFSYPKTNIRQIKNRFEFAVFYFDVLIDWFGWIGTRTR